jgi:hypothetical protein
MAAVNGRRLARPIRLLPHESHHLLPHAPDAPVCAPASPAATAHAAAAAGVEGAGRSSSARELEMSWHHARGHHSQASSVAAARRSRGSGSRAGSFAGQPPAAGRASSSSGSRQQQRQRHCFRSSLAAARMLLTPPLRQRFLPLMVAWLGLCGGWYSTVRCSHQQYISPGCSMQPVSKQVHSSRLTTQCELCRATTSCTGAVDSRVFQGTRRRLDLAVC